VWHVSGLERVVGPRGAGPGVAGHGPGVA